MFKIYMIENAEDSSNSCKYCGCRFQPDVNEKILENNEIVICEFCGIEINVSPISFLTRTTRMSNMNKMMKDWNNPSNPSIRIPKPMNPNPSGTENTSVSTELLLFIPRKCMIRFPNEYEISNRSSQTAIVNKTNIGFRYEGWSIFTIRNFRQPCNSRVGRRIFRSSS